MFVSYRRDDVPDATDRLTTSLFERFGEDHVFLDVDSIEIGSDFGQVVGDWIGRCDVLLVIIGRDWLQVTDAVGRRRLEDPRDYVRLEIEAGLARDTRVVPVLVHGATLPHPTDLPESLVPLLDRQAIELSRPHWNLDVADLANGIERIAARNRGVSPPSTRVPEPATPRPRDGRRRWVAVIAGLIAIAAIAIAIVATSGSSTSTSTGTSTGASKGVSTGASWQQETDFPVAIAGAGAAPYDGQLWIAGGCSNPGGSCGNTKHWVSAVYHYSPQTRLWSPGPSLPAVRAYAALVSDGQHLYAIGGFGPDGRAVATVYRLDRPDGSWQTASASLPQARGGGAAGWDGTRIVFGGGADAGRHARSEVWALSGGQWQQLGRLQKPRNHLAAASDQRGTVWFAGGMLPSGRTSGLVDVVTGSSVRPGSPISPIRGAAGATLASSFCAVGGAKAINILSGAIQCQPPRPAPLLEPGRNFASAAVLGNLLYVVGGFEVGQYGGVRTVESLKVGS